MSNDQLGNVTENAPKGASQSKRSPLRAVVAVLLIGGLVLLVIYALVFSKKGKDTSEDLTSEESSNLQGEWDPDADPNIDRPTVEVVLSEEGFSPDSITVETGTVIIWTNQSGETATVNSVPHPAHTDNPILNLGEVADGDKFSLIFDTPGTYKYHNHLNPTQFGTITVTDEASEESQESQESQE